MLKVLNKQAQHAPHNIDHIGNNQQEEQPPLLLSSLSTESLFEASKSLPQHQQQQPSTIRTPIDCFPSINNQTHNSIIPYTSYYGKHLSLIESPNTHHHLKNNIIILHHYNNQTESDLSLHQTRYHLSYNTNTTNNTFSGSSLPSGVYSIRLREEQDEPTTIDSLSYNNNNNTVTDLSSISNSTPQYYHPHTSRQLKPVYYEQERTRSISLPLPQVKTFQLTSTLDERHLIQMVNNNSNLKVVSHQYDTSPQVSPLSPMPLLVFDVETYKEKFISIIKQGSPDLLVSEKESLTTLGTCPKSKTTVAYWYGKYGGPFTWVYSGPPVDDLDLACRMHDQRLPLKYVKQLVNLIRTHYGDDQLSKDALSYIKKIDGLAFRIIEPVYMVFFGCF